ncbi:MAG: DUF1553 domain-containing protein [Planctomycetota bacterium]
MVFGLMYALALAQAPAGDPIDFDRDVLPILSDHCVQCHGPDAAARKADLRLDVRDDVLFVAEPGAAADSALYQRISHADPARRMPPADFPRQLTPAKIEALRRWIDEGVAWESHWAFTAPTRAAAPVREDDTWSRDALDVLVLGRLAEEGLAPSPPADRATWLRRVTFDLTGLPPDVAALDAYLADDSAEADARVVDRLLASPRRAEHRTREWLDLARYADTNGFQNDFGRDQWPWRDWVLRAFASNLPYDEFIVQQVAGDLLPGAARDALIATGFNRNHRSVTEGGSIDEEWRVEKVADRAETTATAFLGLTLGCARCHDHKFDPLTQRDYYAFYAFFDQVDEQGFYNEARGNVPPLIEVPTPAQEARLAALDASIAAREDELVALAATAPQRFGDWCGESQHPQRLAGEWGRLLLEYAGERREGAPRIELDGDAAHHVNLGQGVSFEQDVPFTVSMWLRPDSNGAVYSRMDDTDRYRGTDLILLGDMRPAVHLIHEWTANAIKVVGVDPLDKGRWQHVAVTYDGSRKASGVKLYVDCVERAVKVEVDTLDGTLATEEPLRIGLRRYAGALAGALHDFRVDALALDVDELLNLARRRPRAEAAALCLTRYFAGSENPEPAELERLAAGALPFFTPFDQATLDARSALADLRRERERLAREGIATVMVMRDRAEPRETRLLDRGQYDRPKGEPLQPDVPAALGGLTADAPRNRLGLARWLVDPANPLVARVAANRVWASFFGAGLVTTPEDFGVRGARPTHRAVLDHLAVSLVDSGWDLQALERRIALSATYRQSSHAAPALRERDPENHLLARGPRHRLDAETVRDQALFAAGLLVERIGGPSVKPYQPAGLWEELAGGAGQGPYVQSAGDDLYRRSLYTYRKRTVPHPTLTTFDAPGFELCVARRARTNTPLQALALWNDPTYAEAARHLAARMWAAPRSAGAGEGVDADDTRLAFGARVVLSRELRAEELRVLRASLDAYRASFGADPAAAAAHLGIGASAGQAAPDGATPTEWAAYSAVAATLLNLDEALTER